MRALRITAVNQLALEEAPAPQPGPGEAVVAIRSAALNHRDVWIKAGQYAGVSFPCQPGSDGAGTVLAVAADADRSWIGRDVLINPGFGWGADERAQGESFSILGLPRPGTLAERVAVPVSQLAPLPPDLSWDEAAALPLSGLTAYRALFTRGALRRGERVLLTGIGGGVALFLLQFAVAQGAEAWVTSSSEDKLARARELGAQGGFLYTDSGWAENAKKNAGPFDLIVDSAGGDGFDRLVELAAPGGRIVFFGATRGNAPSLALRKVFWRQISLLGSTMGSPSDWAAMTEFVRVKRIKPVVSAVYPLSEAADAFALMEEGAQFGKIVVRVAER